MKDVINDAEQVDASPQGAGGTPKKLVKVGPDDEYGRGVPRTSVAGYFKAIKRGDPEQAANYLDLRNLPRGYSANDGPELARQLKVVFDRSLWVEMDLLSTSPKGHSNDGLPPYRDLVGQIEANGSSYDVLVQRVPRSDGVFVWKFSSKTVREIPLLYEALGYGPLGEKFSEYRPDLEMLGLQLWQWVLFVFIMAAAAIVLFPVTRIASWLVQRNQTLMGTMIARFLNGPVYLVAILVMARQNFELIRPSLTARAFFEGGTVVIIIFIWLMVRLVELLRNYWSQKLEKNGQDQAVVLLRPALSIVKIIIVLLGLLIWLDNIGFKVSTVLAGLGIGGLAVALATQKSMENFIGALTLYLAAPVKVGDFCRVGDKMGEVEEIGLRASKLRTLENTIVIVPNAEFANMQIENMAERTRFRFNPTLRLHSETTPDQIRFVLHELQKLFHAHSMVTDSPRRVRFIGFGDHSLDIEIHCYIDTRDLNVFKGVAEDLYLRLMDIIESAGTRIAIPTSIEYQGQYNQPNLDVKQKVEKQVASLRRDGELFADLSQQDIEKIKNSIAYPIEKSQKT